MAGKVTIATTDGEKHEFDFEGNFTTIQRYLNQAKKGEFEEGGHYASILTPNGRLVLNPNEVVSIKEHK